jgi:hypothetical protein
MKCAHAVLAVVSVAAALLLSGCDDGASVERARPVTFTLTGAVTGVDILAGDVPVDIVAGQRVAIRVSYLPSYTGATFGTPSDSNFAVYVLAHDDRNTAVIQIGSTKWTADLRQILLHNDAGIGDRIAVYGEYALGEYTGTTTFNFCDTTGPFDLLTSLDLPSDRTQVGIGTDGRGNGSVQGAGWWVRFSTDEIGE